MEFLNQSEGLNIFEKYESEVRSYVRSFPTVFTKAKGCKMWDVDGKEYIDFLAGAGALNYGHNPDGMKEALLDYIKNDGVTHSLDMATTAKEYFLKRFNEVILKPRDLDYKIMFPGPTGTNTVESALKLARKVTGRSNVISFTNGFHGMTIGALSVTGNSFKRQGAGIPLTNTTSMPYDNFMSDDFDTVEYLERYLENNGSGMDKPAAIIFETVQGEGGINASRFEWMKQIEQVCRKHDIMLIIDDVQAGCGRTGTFFSFEPAGIEPDIVCLSKSIGGYGQPFAITLFKPKYDIWKPGEHNGTFRGNNFAFIAAAEAMKYWEDGSFEQGINDRAKIVYDFLEKIVKEYPELKGEHRGRGLMQGIAVGVDGLADEVCAEAFKRGLIMETSGPKSEVFKLFPPLNIEVKDLEKGLSIIEESVKAAVKEPVKA
ncbi:diaminobutyrate--2-oxoglutarate transaminase [Bacillus tianshenii]|nr:diaminobutyrate--2-oxoglutarate transaminase [Bacillus tianshenii]